MSEWFLINDEKPLSPSLNMARDEYLYHLCHEQKCGFFRLYRWDQPTFSLGYWQKIHKVVDVDYVQTHRLGLVRRITGGKVVLHNDEITYSVTSSEDFFFRQHDLYKSYFLIAQFLAKALQNVGIDVHLSCQHLSNMARSNFPCFSFPTPNEIEVDGRKVIGSAQKRDKYALLQHGSIPMTMDYDLYGRGTGVSPELLKQNMITIREIKQVAVEEIWASLSSTFRLFFNVELKEYGFDSRDNEKIAQLQEKYLSDPWNFRT